MLFTSTTKIIQISIQIDTARSKGQWHAIPNLAKRYVRHNPQGTGLEQIILAEAALARLGQTTKPWDPKQIRTIQDQLQSVFELTDETSEELKESAKVVLARLFFGCQEYDQVLALLEGLSILNAQSPGYRFILYYQSMAIKAMSLEMMGQTEDCLKLYEHILKLLDDQQPVKDWTLVEWAEQTLYRANLFISNQKLSIAANHGTQLEFLRSYHKVTYLQPGTWQTERRLNITLLMIKLLSKLNKSGVYIPPTILDTTGPHDTQDIRRAFAEEMTQLYTICEHMLYSTTITGDSNTLVLEMVESLALDMDWIAETTEDWWGYKEVLERASEKTFNSPVILRLLFYVLIQLGEYEEAQQSLQIYLQLVGLVSYEHIETQQDGSAAIQDIHGRYLPLPQPSAQSLTASTTAIKRHGISNHNDDYNHMDGESITNQLGVLLKSIEMFCKELSKGIKATEMAELALDLVQSSTERELKTKQKSEVYHLSGIAYGLLASQTIDNELRPIYHEKALVLLQQSKAILPDSWEIYYSLAYQQAEMHNIDHAIQLVQHSLKLNNNHIPSWHLLTLALSCHGQKDHDKALIVASAGLDLWTDGNDLPPSYEQHEYYLLLQMTHNRILGTLKGLENKALEKHPSLFKLYMKWQAQGSSNDSVDLALAESGIGVDVLWYGRPFYCGDDNGNDMAPRKPAVYGSLGNISSITLSTHTTPYPGSSNSTSLASPVMKPSKSSRPRSASSSTLTHPFLNNNGNGLANGDSASMLTTGEPVNNSDSSNTYGTADDSKTPSILAQRSPTLRKHASNSMLKVPGSNQSSHHWHGIHLFPSRSASRRQTPAQTSHVVSISMNGSTSNESISKKSVLGNEGHVSRYNSEYSIQSGASSGVGGGHTTTSSIHDSFTTTASATTPSISLPSLLVPQKQTAILTARDYLRNQQKHIRLCELWLMAGEWYFALSEWEEALKAISEAESVCPSHHDVWYLLGKIDHNKTKYTTTTTTNGIKDCKEQYQGLASAIQFLEKGLLIRPGHVGCQLELAKLYMEQQDYCLAEGILVSMTQGFGWNSPEAWYLLGTIYQLTGRKQQAKKYLFYALELESSCPIQPFSILPRVM